MDSPVFRFKKFDIAQDRCAMKVGTDGVLLGAWIETRPARRILDVGTGTGLIALMVAQRFDAPVDAVELDAEACEQANRNFAASPWASRLHAEPVSLQQFAIRSRPRYDLIVSNPPFYINAFDTPSKSRNIARHSNTALPFADLVSCVARLLLPGGRLALILPAREGSRFLELAREYGLTLRRRTRVMTGQGDEEKRWLMELGPGNGTPVEDRISVRDRAGRFTEEYIRLTGDYYLGLKDRLVAGR